MFAWRLFVVLYIDPMSVMHISRVDSVHRRLRRRLQQNRACRSRGGARFARPHPPVHPPSETELAVRRRWNVGYLPVYWSLHFSSCWHEVVSLMPPCYVITYTISTNWHMRCLIQSVIRRYCSVMCHSCRAEVFFKLDTGADVTVISQSDYRRACSPSLDASTKRLVGANDNVLQTLGMFIGRLSHGGARSSMKTSTSSVASECHSWVRGRVRLWTLSN